jgi:hypothetical protein
MKKYIVTLVSNSNLEFKILGTPITDTTNRRNIADRLMAYYGTSLQQYVVDAIMAGKFSIKEL